MKYIPEKQKRDILGYLNIIGFTLLFYGAVLGMILLRESLTKTDISSLLSLLIITAGTYHSVPSSFPYTGKIHPTFMLIPRYLLKHLILSVREIYSLQMKIVTIGFVCLLIIFPTQYGWIILSILTVFIYWLSFSLVTIYRIIGKILHFLIIYCIYFHQELAVIFLLCLSTALLVLNFKIGFYFPRSYFSLRTSQTKNNLSLFKLLRNMAMKNLAVVLVFCIISIFVTYLAQKTLMTFNLSIVDVDIPFFFLSISAYITLLDVMIGKESKELGLDKNLAMLCFLNKNLNNYKAFRNSQSLFLAHVIVLSHSICTIGLIPFLLEGNLVLFITNLLMIPFIYFISFCYFVKSIRIVSGSLSVFKWVFLILYFILMTILVIGERL